MSYPKALSRRAAHVFLVVFVIALALETRLPLSQAEHQIVLCGIMLGFYFALFKTLLAPVGNGRQRAGVPLKLTTVYSPALGMRRFDVYRRHAVCRRLQHAARRNEVNWR